MVTLEKDYELFSTLRNMRHINRCGIYPTIKPEDVCQHSYYVALLTYILGNEYNLVVVEHNKDLHPYDVDNQMTVIDVDKAVKAALVHDVEEVFISDIPWTVKHHDKNTEKTFTDLKAKILDEKFLGSDVLSFLKYDCRTSKDGLEGELVNLADMLELVIYCSEEITFGNKNLTSVWNKGMEVLEGMDIYTILYKESRFFQRIITESSMWKFD